MAVIEQNKSTSGWRSSIPTTEICKHVTQATVGAKMTSSHTEKSGALLEGPLTVSPGMAGLFAPSPSCLDYNREQCCLMGKGIYGQQKAWWLVCKLSTLAAGISFPPNCREPKTAVCTFLFVPSSCFSSSWLPIKSDRLWRGDQKSCRGGLFFQTRP